MKWREGCGFAECYGLHAKQNRAEAMRFRKSSDRSSEQRKEDSKTKKIMIEVERPL